VNKWELSSSILLDAALVLLPLVALLYGLVIAVFFITRRKKRGA